jgi:hypothetical protein
MNDSVIAGKILVGVKLEAECSATDRRLRITA